MTKKKHQIDISDHTPILSERTRTIIVAVIVGIAGMFTIINARAASQINPAWSTLGVYQTSGTKTVARHESFEDWLGRDLLFADVNMGYRNTPKAFSEASSNVWNFFERTPTADAPNWTSRTDVTLASTLPLVFDSEDKAQSKNVEYRIAFMDDVANGKYDDDYKSIAKRWVEGGHGDDIIRLGHEPELSYPWNYKDGAHEAYERAWLHVREVMKSVAPNLRFDYQGNGRWHRNNPATGTTYAESVPKVLEAADIIGVDIYDGAPWEAVLERLEYTRDLAIKYGKQMSIPEWGLREDSGKDWGGNGDNPSFIQNMYDFINSLPRSGPGSIAYHVYFDGHAETNLDNHPNSKKLFLELFGEQNAPRNTNTPDPKEAAPDVVAQDTAEVITESVDELIAEANQPVPNNTVVEVTDTEPIATPVIINSGGGSGETAGGTTVIADKYFTRGSTSSISDTTEIDNTVDDFLYHSERWASSSIEYSIPLLEDDYEVTLHFAEIFNEVTGPEQRRFTASIEGVQREGTIDPFAITDGRNSASTRNYSVSLSDGVLNIALNGTTANDAPKISAIEIRSFSQPAPTANNPVVAPTSLLPFAGELPFIINAGGDSNALSSNGLRIVPDQFFTGGAINSQAAGEEIANTDDDSLYQSERWDNRGFGYEIPIAIEDGEGGRTESELVVTLHFAEIFDGVTAAGQRSFDVVIEGGLVLDNFDPYSQGNGLNSASKRSFSVIDNDGILEIEFLRAEGSPKISAIEVARRSTVIVAPVDPNASENNGGTVTVEETIPIVATPQTNTPTTSQPREVSIVVDADLSNDGQVNSTDLQLLLQNWGSNNAAADLTNDGTVDVRDISLLLENWSN